jgi:hypothetical protein
MFSLSSRPLRRHYPDQVMGILSARRVDPPPDGKRAGAASSPASLGTPYWIIAAKIRGNHEKHKGRNDFSAFLRLAAGPLVRRGMLTKCHPLRFGMAIVPCGGML